MKTRQALWTTALLLGLVAGCKSKPSHPEYMRGFQSSDAPVERGSLEDINRRRNAGRSSAAPLGPQTMQFLVVHDAEGRAVYVELKRGSGNPDLDRRARLHIIESMKFKPGKADTVIVTLEPDEVPRPRAPGR